MKSRYRPGVRATVHDGYWRRLVVVLDSEAPGKCWVCTFLTGYPMVEGRPCFNAVIPEEFMDVLPEITDRDVINEGLQWRKR